MDDPAIRAWAASVKACWELLPLVEMRQGQRLQVGFELDLYARIPPRESPSAARLPAVEALWDRLRELAQSLLPLLGERARLEVEPFDAAGRLRPETEFAPEVLLKARLVHEDYFSPLVEADREAVRRIQARLLELGLRERGW